jgi:hypothetical protein
MQAWFRTGVSPARIDAHAMSRDITQYKGFAGTGFHTSLSGTAVSLIS